MDTQAEVTARAGRRRGKNGAPDAATINLKEVRDKIGELKQLCRAKNGAATDYAEAVEAVATRAGVDKSALKAFIGAAVGDQVQRKREMVSQLNLLFEEIGA